MLCSSVTQAQHRNFHYFHSASMPPGSVGQGQLAHDPRLPGHFQTVQVIAPEGAKLAIAMDGNFTESEKGPLLAGLLVGQVYQFKVTEIPFNEGSEVFPTIELVNR